MKWLKLKNPRQAKKQKWLQEEHMRTFTHWLRKKVQSDFKHYTILSTISNRKF